MYTSWYDLTRRALHPVLSLPKPAPLVQSGEKPWEPGFESFYKTHSLQKTGMIQTVQGIKNKDWETHRSEELRRLDNWKWGGILNGILEQKKGILGKTSKI